MPATGNLNRVGRKARRKAWRGHGQSKASLDESNYELGWGDGREKNTAQRRTGATMRAHHFPTYDSTGSTMPDVSSGMDITFIAFQS